MADLIGPRQEAEANQRAASDPAVSAFVAASAGSGKTRLLTDRLLRLMIDGARPEKILCLTFTRAAAAEMSLRLRSTLGRWVTMDDANLRQALLDLSIAPSEAATRRARSLFALVLDLPGGMRIGTIHAFCQSLLRRFPLEAQISPHFQLADQRDADEIMAEACEGLLAGLRPRGTRTSLSDQEISLQSIAALSSLRDFRGLVSSMKGRVAGPGVDQSAARRRFLGVKAPDRASVILAASSWHDEDTLRAAARYVESRGTGDAKKNAAKILDWLRFSVSERAANWDYWRGLFLTEKGEPRTASKFVPKAVCLVQPDLLRSFLSEAERIIAVDDHARAIDVAVISEALADLAGSLLDGYQFQKEASGLVEYDDLIMRSQALLSDPGVQWVLYKLDGGLDHLLLDEVQDTAPEQWEIAHSLTHEFFAGEGARDKVRTVFAVGDGKQSIFSFQGADVAGFFDARDRLGSRVSLAGRAWVERPLDVSFRSTEPVLALVDAVFADPTASAGVVSDGQTLTHRAVRTGQAGRVELWPLTEAPQTAEPVSWTAPGDTLDAQTASEALADKIARWIQEGTNGGVLLRSKGRALRPGDVMILLRQRNKFAPALVRSLKSIGIPVAGLDRMVLTEQPAVQDLMTLGDALLLPQDDLTFASLLTSPLGGLDDNDLMELAIGRRKPLWETLRDRHEESASWTHAWTFFSALLGRADYVTPHALFAEALGALGGRARLLARLGAEAMEPIDELLNVTLSHGKSHPPSLQGFLQWLRRSGAEITREAGGASDQVRILTVHGAKGLQAPLVILPDTTGLPPNQSRLLWIDDPPTGRPIPIWTPRAEFNCRATRRVRDEVMNRQWHEQNRLLYVALTRAEDHLVICGVKPKRSAPHEKCWYRAAARGFARLVETRDNVIAIHETPQTVAPVMDKRDLFGEEPASPPAFIGTPPEPEPARPSPLAPSRPEGVALGVLPPGASPLARVGKGADRFLRGQLIHGLLQHLPALPEQERHAAARRFLSPSRGVTEDAASAIADEVMAILNHPELSPLFGVGSRAEVPLTGVIGNVVVGGLVDRLAVLRNRVLMADYKTDLRTPRSADGTPIAYLRQMASYRAVLRSIFPDRPVQCALVWTRDARVSILPDTLLDPHEPGVSLDS